MLRLSLALDNFFQERDMYDRIEIAAELGFEGVELCSGFRGLNPSRLRHVANENGVQLVNAAINDAFQNTLNRPFSAIWEPVTEAVSFAVEAGIANVVMLGGEAESPMDSPKNIIIENLKRSGEIAARAGVNILLEPLNNIMEHRGQYLVSSVMAFEIVKCVDSPHISVLYDVYHMQVMEGNILHNMTRNLEMIKHVHVVGIPNHDEPFHCEINYLYVLDQLERAGYKHFIGVEYKPSYDDRQSLLDTLRYLKSSPMPEFIRAVT
jgi:hydroxypyruvate isomerase